MQSLVTNEENKTCLSHEFLDFLISFPLTHEQLLMILAFLHRSYENHDELTATIGFSREKSTRIIYELVELGIMELGGGNWISLSGYRIPFSVRFHIKNKNS